MASTPPSPRVVAVIPTYNEAGNIEALVRELLALPLPGVHVLVADDNSPDGTAAIVRAAAAADPRVDASPPDETARTGLRGHRRLQGRPRARGRSRRRDGRRLLAPAPFHPRPSSRRRTAPTRRSAPGSSGAEPDSDRSIVRRGITWCGPAVHPPEIPDPGPRRFVRLPLLHPASLLGDRCRRSYLVRALDRPGDPLQARPSGAPCPEVPIEFVDRAPARRS